MKACKVIYRGEGNSKIGLGHLSRLTAFANNLEGLFSSEFIVSTSSDITIIPSDYKVNVLEEELTVIKEIDWLKRNYDTQTTVFVLDGYQFDESYQFLLKKNGFRFIYIDDLVTGKQYADIVLNHAVGVSPDEYRTTAVTKLALGTKYALLRQSFLNEISKDREINIIETAFVCFGGADPLNITQKSIEAFLAFHEIKKINIVLGSAYKHLDSLEVFKENDRVNLCVNLNEEEMLSVMKESQISIVPSSTIVYELCCVKMAIISGYYVNNQVKIYNGLSKEGVIEDAGDISDYSVEDFKEKISKVLFQNDINKMMIRQKELFNQNIKQNIINLINDLC